MGEGFELAREEINHSQLNGAKITFIIEDDGTTPVQGAVERLSIN